jgi:hypothetical protein
MSLANSRTPAFQKNKVLWSLTNPFVYKEMSEVLRYGTMSHSLEINHHS